MLNTKIFLANKKKTESNLLAFAVVETEEAIHRNFKIFKRNDNSNVFIKFPTVKGMNNNYIETFTIKSETRRNEFKAAILAAYNAVIEEEKAIDNLPK